MLLYCPVLSSEQCILLVRRKQGAGSMEMEVRMHLERGMVCRSKSSIIKSPSYDSWA